MSMVPRTRLEVIINSRNEKTGSYEEKGSGLL